VDDEARPDQPAEAEHHGEQPNDARDAGLVGELDFEAREIDLGCAPGGVSNHISKVLTGSGLISRTVRFTAVYPPTYPRSRSSRHSRTAVRPGYAASRSRKYGRKGSVLLGRRGLGP
jgi:hypothetical protein